MNLLKFYMCARGEMDIITGFGPVVVGSSPAGRAN